MHKYKVLIVKNRFKKKFDFKKGIEWFSKKTPINLNISEIETDFDTVSRDITNGTFTGCVLDNSAKAPLRLIVPRNTYHAVVVLDGNEARLPNKKKCIRVSLCDSEPLYPETEFIQVVKFTDEGGAFNHELIHSFFHRLWRKGIQLVDPMDTYINDKDMDAPVSNRTMAVERLEPYWTQICDLGTITPMVAMTSEMFDEAFTHLMKWEGGYVNDPKDPGGETKYGICKRSYPSLDIASLKLEDAKKIYFTDYWKPNKCDSLPYPIALNIFDISVNMGVKTGAMTLQEALGVEQDGKIGPVTIAAATKANTTDLIEKIAVIRIQKYIAIKDSKTFLKGWLNRTLDTVTTSLS